MRRAMQGQPAAIAAGGDVYTASARPLVLGIAERPLGVDELLARTFWQMRSSLGLPVEHVAAYLRTTPDMIRLLESGDLRGLPSWQETLRVVVAYAHWLQLDPSPIVDRMHHQIVGARGDIGDVGRRPSIDGSGPIDEIAADQALSTHVAPPNNALSRRRRRRGSLLFALTAPLLLGGALTYAAHVRPAPIMAAISALPRPVEQPVRMALDFILLHTSPRHNGFVWIDVADPQTRKSDRLPSTNR